MLFKRVLLTLLIYSCSHSSYADKIAIIGGGASGVVSAWLLENNHEITLYEAQDRLGGHANTLQVNAADESIAIEAGAEFFNEKYYPHLMKLLRLFKIPIHSFTLVTTFYRTDGRDFISLPPVHDKKVEWKSFTAINLDRMLKLKKIISNGRKILDYHRTTITLENYLDSLKIPSQFRTTFFYPVLGAAWGIPPNKVAKLSAFNALKYMIEAKDAKNYRWFEALPGLKAYIEAIEKSLKKTTIKLNNPIINILPSDKGYVVIDSHGDREKYDRLILATDANVAGKLLRNIPQAKLQFKELQRIKYYKTIIAIHGDKRFMPPDKKYWRVINIRYNGKSVASTMYKSWRSKHPIFKTWITYDVRAPNDLTTALPHPLYALKTYYHAYTNVEYYKAQHKIAVLQGKGNIWFAGVWTNDNDSHESALNSAINIAKQLSPHSERLRFLLN